MPTKTLHDLLRDYLAYKAALHYSQATLNKFRNNVHQFLSWLEERYQVETADRLRKEHIDQWQRHLAGRQTREGTPLKARSINKSIESARGFFKYLAFHSYITSELAVSLQYVKEPKTLPGSILTHTEMKKLLRRIDTTTPTGYRNRAMLELLYTSGIRVGEMLGLDVDHVDVKQATAMVTGKGKKDRVVPIGKTALHYLESYIVAVRPYLVADPVERALFIHRGHRMKYQVFLHMVHAAAEHAKIDKHVSPHTFRRSCTTELIRSGANIYHVKELLGHETLDTLKHYTKLTILDLKKTHERCHPREKETSS